MYLELNAEEAALEPQKRHFFPWHRISVRPVGQGRADPEPCNTGAAAALRHRIKVKAAEADTIAVTA